MCNSSIQLGTSCLKEEKVEGKTISKNNRNVLEKIVAWKATPNSYEMKK